MVCFSFKVCVFVCINTYLYWIGVNAEWLDQMLNKHSSNSSVYKSILIDKLLQIIHMSSQPSK